MDKKVKDLNDRVVILEQNISNILDILTDIRNILSNPESCFNSMPIKTPKVFGRMIEFYDTDFILYCLKQKHMTSDLLLLKKIYFDNIDPSLLSLKHIGRKYKYWMNDKFNDDDGTYIKDTIYNNIYTLYTMVNTSSFLENIDDIVPNSNYIISMDTATYKNTLYKKFIAYIPYEPL
ncbi:MAG: hypothetical protein AAB906_04670 [Patescibacteria group bacterium]